MLKTSPPPGPHEILGFVAKRPTGAQFVGRAQELTQIMKAVEHAAEGKPGLILIGGEAGIGKTRLIEQVSRLTGPLGVRLALGACVEYGIDGVPLSPLAQLLRSLQPDRAPNGTKDALSGRVLAELLSETVTPPTAGGAHQAPERLFHAILGLIENLGTDSTAILVIEDIHNADSATAALLGFLARSLRGVNILILATYRTGQYLRHPRVPELIADLERHRITERIELNRFKRREVAAQLHGILGYDVDESLVQEVYARTEGIPYFTEILAHGLEQSDGVLPRTLRDLLIGRIYQLPDATRRMLHVLAAGGLEVSHDILVKVATLPNQQLTAALRPAFIAGIVELSADHTGYRFHHALTYEAVEQDMLPGERVELHLAYAEALEADGSRPPDDRATEIARHYYAAHDVERALPALLRAAEVAATRYAFDEELLMLERALELWSRSDGEERPRQEDLLYRAAVAAGQAGHPARALSLAEAGLDLLGSTEEEGLLTARFLIETAKNTAILARGDGVEKLTGAIKILRGLHNDDESMIAHALLAHVLMVTGRYTWSLETAEAGLAIASRTGSHFDRINMRITQGTCLAWSDVGTAKGLALLRGAYGEAVQIGDATLSGRAAVNTSSVLNTIGRHREALDIAQEALTGLRHALPWVIDALLYTNLIEALFRLGEWDNAAAMLEEALEREFTGIYAAGLWVLRAMISLARGETQEATYSLERSRRLGINSSMEPQYVIFSANIEAEAARVEGRVADARLVLRRVIEFGEGVANDEYIWPLIISVARAEADQAEQCRTVGTKAAPESLTTIERLRALADGQVLPNPNWTVYAAIANAEYARWADTPTAPEWEAARIAAEQHPISPHDNAYILLRCAQNEYARDRLDRAMEFSSHARAIAEKLGLRPLLAELDLLEPPVQDESADVSREPDAESPHRELTRRELEVLKLVAEGRTNGQIGRILYITTKTASTHVSKILGKLGVSTRTEAAAAAHRLGLIR